MVPCSLLTRLTLHKEGGRYYISYQEDFFHPDVSKFCSIGVVMGVLMPCGAPFHTGIHRVDSTTAFQARGPPSAVWRLRMRLVCAPCTSSFRYMESSSG
jgi:hypothetical protein